MIITMTMTITMTDNDNYNDNDNGNDNNNNNNDILIRKQLKWCKQSTHGKGVIGSRDMPY